MQLVPMEGMPYTCNPNRTKKKVTMIQQELKVSKEWNMKCKEFTNVQQFLCPGEVGTEPPVTVSQSKRGHFHKDLNQ